MRNLFAFLFWPSVFGLVAAFVGLAVVPWWPATTIVFAMMNVLVIVCMFAVRSKRNSEFLERCETIMKSPALSIFALFAFAAIASANPPQARAVICPPQAVYAPPQVIYQQPAVQFVQPAQVDYCAPQAVYVPQVRLRAQVYAQPAQVYYPQQAAVLYPQQAIFGGAGVAIARRQGLFERLGNRQAGRRDAQALRSASRSQLVIVR